MANEGRKCASPAPPGDELTPSSRLCTSCGLCCRGLLHNRAMLESSEVAKATKLGFEILDQGKLAFSLPCPRFEGCCTVYDQRPKACVGFKCSLLRNLESGNTDLVTAMGRVAEAHRLIEQAEITVPQGAFVMEFRAHIDAVRKPVEPSASDDPESMTRSLRMTALGFYLDKYFVRPKDGTFFSSRIIETPTEKEADEPTEV